MLKMLNLPDDNSSSHLFLVSLKFSFSCKNFASFEI